MITRGIYTAAKGMESLLDLNDTIANNLANVNTTGFKKSALTFRNVYDATVEQSTPPGEEYKRSEWRNVGTLSVGPETHESIVQFTQGTLERTGNPLNIAIQGDGFFKVKNLDGNIAYTRNGDLTLDGQDYLITTDGERILDNVGQPVKISLEATQSNRNQIVINEDGQIVINNPNSPQMLQKIGLYDFADKREMISLGNGKFIPKDLQENPEIKAGKFSIQQGAVELSNTNTINEMISSIQVSRCYETLSKLVQQDSELLSQAINLGKLK